MIYIKLHQPGYVGCGNTTDRHKQQETDNTKTITTEHKHTNVCNPQLLIAFFAPTYIILYQLIHGLFLHHKRSIQRKEVGIWYMII